MADKKLLRQIITNLLTNAIKYSPDHNLVNFSLSRKNDQLVFKITDYGIGIPAADQAHLFEYFQRGSNVGTLPGTGLGLSIVKKCVDLHQGEITLDSELGKGTVFTVTLPFLKG
ncbi:MAG: sensor histidine kinase [Dolichospermum sp.]